jgi:predicted XRE-type DNA-binding protein
LKVYNSAFGLLTNNKERLEDYKQRSHMMNKIVDSIKTNNWTQKQAAINLDISRTKISEMQAGMLSVFSYDSLAAMVDKLVLIEESKS